MKPIINLFQNEPQDVIGITKSNSYIPYFSQIRYFLYPCNTMLLSTIIVFHFYDMYNDAQTLALATKLFIHSKCSFSFPNDKIESWPIILPNEHFQNPIAEG